jgi:hypothetical protein
MGGVSIPAVSATMIVRVTTAVQMRFAGCVMPFAMRFHFHLLGLNTSFTEGSIPYRQLACQA